MIFRPCSAYTKKARSDTLDRACHSAFLTRPSALLLGPF